MEDYSNEMLISPEELKHLSPAERKKMIRAVILDTLKKAERDGITANEIALLTNLDSRTASKHLEYLAAIREAYVVERGQYKIYYPNGKLTNPRLNWDREFTGNRETRFFNYSLISNVLGDFVYVQEKSKDPFNRFSVSGGILINLDYADEFIEVLEDFVEEVKRWRGQELRR